jgi:hypothetical protein
VHCTIEQRFKRANLSGTYLTFDNLDVEHCNTTPTLSYHEGILHESNFGMAPVTLYELRTIAITLLGIPAQQLPVAVHINDVNRFLYENINSYWKTWLTEHAAMEKKKLLLILLPRLTEWVILGVARQLYTLRTGKIASKTSAGYYCLEQLPNKYHTILQEAINIRGDVRKHRLYLKTSYYVQPSLKRTIETLDGAHFIIDQFNREYNPATENSRKTQKHFARKIKELIRDVLKNSTVTDSGKDCAINRWAGGDNGIMGADFYPLPFLSTQQIIWIIPEI